MSGRQQSAGAAWTGETALCGVAPPLITPLDAPGDVRKTAAGVRQYDFKLRIFIERAGNDELGGRRGAVKRESQRVVDIGRLCQGVAAPFLSAVVVLVAVERVDPPRRSATRSSVYPWRSWIGPIQK